MSHLLFWPHFSDWILLPKVSQNWNFEFFVPKWGTIFGAKKIQIVIMWFENETVLVWFSNSMQEKKTQRTSSMFTDSKQVKMMHYWQSSYGMLHSWQKNATTYTTRWNKRMLCSTMLPPKLRHTYTPSLTIYTATEHTKPPPTKWQTESWVELPWGSTK